MKKITIVLIILIGFMFPSSVFAKKFDFGKILDKEIDRQIEVQQKRQRDNEERRRRELDDRSRQKMEEERNRSRIKQEQERAEALKRREQLKDLQFQQELEIETERQERERRARNYHSGGQPAEATHPPQNPSNSNVPNVEVDIYEDGTCRVRGENQIFQNWKELKDFLTWQYNGGTIYLKIFKQ